MNMPTFNITIAKHGRNLVHVSDFRIEENKITFLFGESGIGKSLLRESTLWTSQPGGIHYYDQRRTVQPLL